MKKMTWWQKFQLEYFHICPCGGKLESQGFGKWACSKCPAHYGDGAKNKEWEDIN